MWRPEEAVTCPALPLSTLPWTKLLTEEARLVDSTETSDLELQERTDLRGSLHQCCGLNLYLHACVGNALTHRVTPTLVTLVLLTPIIAFLG